MNTASPTLSDDRVESMRSTVMMAVDRDIQRRGRRSRQVIGLVAASVVVIGFGSYAFGSLSTSRHQFSSSDSADAGSSAQDSKYAEIAPMIDGGDDAGGSSADEPASEGALSAARREVITTGSINVTVKAPREVAQKLSSWVDSIGGRVDGRTENGSGKDASAFVRVRVPSAKVTATIDRLKTYGTVTNVTLRNDDVTAQGQDLDARIRALDLSIGRLEKILTEADTSTEVIKAETALTNRQEQLESLQAERAGLSEQVALSTLEIDLSQKAKAESVSSGGFTGGLLDGWNALVSTVNAVVQVIGALLPWAAIVIVLWFAYRLIARRRGWN